MEYEWYADVFFLEEAFRDFLILRLAACLLRQNIRPLRLAAAALLGAGGSLFAVGFGLPGSGFASFGPGSLFAAAGPGSFLAPSGSGSVFSPSAPGPTGPVFFLLYLFAVESLMAALAFPVRGIRGILQADGAILFSSAVLGGAVLLLSQYFYLGGLESLGVLGFSSLAASVFFRKFQESRAVGKLRFRVILSYGGRQKEFLALADSGNRLREPVTGKPVTVISYGEAKELCGRVSGVLYIPYRAVGTAGGILPGIVMEKMEIFLEDGIHTIEKPVVAVSKEPLSAGGDFTMLLPESLIL